VVQGRTIYTIHAASAVERSDGKMTLHDVGLCSTRRKQDRQTGSTGKSFEYDQKNEIIRAVGEVHIDLQAPEAGDANAKRTCGGEGFAGRAGRCDGVAGNMRVKTIA